MLVKFATVKLAVVAAEIARPDAPSTFLQKSAHRADFTGVARQPGYLYVRSRAISSRTNDNWDRFPAEEIKKGYRTFIGKPVFVNHNNSNHRRARGVIVDAALHEDTAPDGTPDTWCEVLMQVDAIRFPKLAQAVIAGHIARTSMGVDVAQSRCNLCGNIARTPSEYCLHLPHWKGKKARRRNSDGSHEDITVSEICEGLAFFENSLLVEPPADPTALVTGIEAGPGIKLDAALHTATPASWTGHHQTRTDGDNLYETHNSHHTSQGRIFGGRHLAFQPGTPEWETHWHSPDKVEAAPRFLQRGAAQYRAAHGFKEPEGGYADIVADKAHSKRVAQAYDRLPSKDPKAGDAYRALAREVGQQYEHLTKNMGVKVEYTHQDPYANHHEMVADMAHNHRLRVLKTDTTVGSTGAHPYLNNEENDEFRACFVAGTLVRTRTGFSPIEQICAGDEVLSIDGSWNRVQTTMARSYEGDVLDIVTNGSFDAITVTPDHPFWVLQAQHIASNKKECCQPYVCQRFFKKTGKWVNAEKSHRFGWVKAGDLTKGTWWPIVVDQQTTDLASVTVPLEHYGRLRTTGMPIAKGPLEYELTPEFLWILGFYIAEGSVNGGDGTHKESRTTVAFACADYEVEYQNRIVAFADQHGWRSVVDPHREHGCIVKIYSALLAKWWPAWLGKGANNKKIPSELLQLPANKLQHLAQGIFDGDGRKARASIDQTSQQLALQMIEVANRLGYQATTGNNDDDNPNHHEVYRIHELVMSQHSLRHKPGTWRLHGQDCRKIKSITRRRFTGTVYNLSVENHETYVVQTMPVHNCHDAFGHAATGRPFDRHGEEAAWAHHSSMFSPLARAAMTTETRGQNASLIHNGHFPEQKAGLLPKEFWDDNAVRSVRRAGAIARAAVARVATREHQEAEWTTFAKAKVGDRISAPQAGYIFASETQARSLAHPFRTYRGVEEHQPRQYTRPVKSHVLEDDEGNRTHYPRSAMKILLLRQNHQGNVVAESSKEAMLRNPNYPGHQTALSLADRRTTLRVSDCNRCGHAIAWNKSKAGKWYPCNVQAKQSEEYGTNSDVLRAKPWSVHKCSPSEVTSMRHLAYGEVVAPADVDTLQNTVCPVCHESDSFNGDRCAVCDFVKPPSMMMDPDLEVAKEVDLRQDQQLFGDQAMGGDLVCPECGAEFSSEEEAAAQQEMQGQDPSQQQPGQVPPGDQQQDELPEWAEQGEDQSQMLEDPFLDEEEQPEGEEEDPDQEQMPRAIQPDENPAQEPEPPDEPPAPDETASQERDITTAEDDEDKAQADRAEGDTEQARSEQGRAGEDIKKADEADGSEAKQEGDPCPNCGKGELKRKDQPPTDEDEDSDETSSEDDTEDDDSKGDDKDGKDSKSKPPWLKDKKSSLYPTNPIAKEFRVAMTPNPAQQERTRLLQALRRQQAIIQAQALMIATHDSQIVEIARLAGVEDRVGEIAAPAQQRIAQLLRQADQANPAQPIPSAPSEGPAQTTDEARAPAGTDDVMTPGASPVTDVSADAVTSVDQPFGETANEPLDLNEENVTSPVAGTEEMRPPQETITEVDVQVGNPDNPQPAFPLEGGPFGAPAAQQVGASKGRTFASLRLARLRLAADIASGDDLSLAESIDNDSSISDSQIASEIETLSKVVQRQGNGVRPTASRRLVPRSASADGVERTAPSLSSTASRTPASEGISPDLLRPTADEMLFE